MMNVPSYPESFALSPYVPLAVVGDVQDSGLHRDHHLGFLDTPYAAASSALALPLTGTAGIAGHDIFPLYPGGEQYNLGGSAYGAGVSGFPLAAYYSAAQPAAGSSLASDYYFGGQIGAAPLADDTVSIATTQLGLNLGYRTFFPPRGGYALGHQPPRCQVEGCKADLSPPEKKYHRRHKVCEYHSKQPVVIISGGLQQRFCQQCSRFHSLDEFDDTKKSCRKRLAEHNRRRRKGKAGTGSSTPGNSTADKKKHGTSKSSTTRDSKNKGQQAGVTTGGWGSKDHLMAVIKQQPSLTLGGPKETDKLPSFLPVLEGKAATLHEHQTSSTSLPFPSPSLCFDHHSLGYLNAVNEMPPGQAGQPNMGFGQHHQPLGPQGSVLQLGQTIFELDFI